MTAPAPIRLHLLPDAPDGDGEPRAGLLIPPTVPARRPILLLFATVALAVQAKAEMEGERG